MYEIELREKEDAASVVLVEDIHVRHLMSEIASKAAYNT